MKKFLKKFKQTSQTENENTPEWEVFTKKIEFAKPIIENYGGVTFNNGLFRIHTKASAHQWTNLLTNNISKKKWKAKICFVSASTGKAVCIASTATTIKLFILTLQPANIFQQKTFP